jgi:hypothetical protein
VVAFIVCWLGPTVFHLADWIAGYKAFWAVMIIVIFTPLQGFWNAFVYARPTYLRLRRKDPDIGRYMAVKMVFLHPDPLGGDGGSSYMQREGRRAASGPASWAPSSWMNPTSTASAFVASTEDANGEEKNSVESFDDLIALPEEPGDEEEAEQQKQQRVGNGTESHRTPEDFHDNA